MFNRWQAVSSILVYLQLLVSMTVVVNSQPINKAKASFVTPSGNIHCAVVGEDRKMLRCEIQSMLRPLPPQPYASYCEYDWGAGFSLNQCGKPKILCISDTISNNSYKLPYGSTWRHSGFKCISKKAGLVCSNLSGNGFSLNRNKWSSF
jgi:hypothetical protein